jgi:hypothetical protein
LQIDGKDGRRTRVPKGSNVSRAEAESARSAHLALPSVEVMARTWTVPPVLLLWLSERANRLRPSTAAEHRRQVITLPPTIAKLKAVKRIRFPYDAAMGAVALSDPQDHCAQDFLQDRHRRQPSHMARRPYA